MKKKIKIAHILNAVGGVDISLRLIISNLNSENFENIIIKNKDKDKKSYINNQKQSIKEYQTRIVRQISPLNDIIALFHIIKILRKNRPDIIHTHSAKGGILGRFCGKFLGIKVLHTPQAFSYLSAKNKFKRTIYIFIEKVFRNNNTILLASSNSEMKRAIFEVKYDVKKTVLFNNSINPITEINSLKINKTWPDNYICTVGRPSYQKNIDLMLDVLKSIKNEKEDIHLVLMGVGLYSPELEKIKNKIILLNIKENITLLDWTSREDVLYIIKNAKVYISTARYEGLPYSIIESLALSTPCVVSNCDGNRDLIINGINGYIIEDNDFIPKFKTKVIEILNNDKLYNALSESALSHFNTNFNINNTINNLEDIYIKYCNYGK